MVIESAKAEGEERVCFDPFAIYFLAPRALKFFEATNIILRRGHEWRNYSVFFLEREIQSQRESDRVIRPLSEQW